MLTVHSFLPSATVRLLGKATFAESVESYVDTLWLERQRLEPSLFNGRIVSAVSFGAQQILARQAEYRHLIAQSVRPELFNVLQVRPIAVCGLLECAGGIVFGRRASSVSQDAGLWELVPSGGLRGGDGAEGSAIDYRADVLHELNEELGLAADAVMSLQPFCLVEDPDSHVLDIGIRMSCGLSASEVRSSHQKAATREYDEVLVVPRSEVRAFGEAHAKDLVGVSLMLIQRAEL